MEGPSKNRHQQVMCGECKRVVRSDNLKRHLKTHQEKNADQPTASTQPTEITRSAPGINETRARLERNQAIYEENIKVGEEVSEVFSAGGISERSLSKEDAYCLDLYRKHCGLLKVKDVVFRE